MGTRVLPGVAELVEAGALGLPDARGRRERFRRYAREHFVALEFGDELVAGLTARLIPHPRFAVQPCPAALVQPARRRAAGRTPGLARLARLSRVVPGAEAL
ncbi:hypothetical protein ACFYNO_00335 [Kitasatospora sp. NPDC006697]|uniref:hypothetical protein n=1 Tax=Kitasatospora sp. NPDC006697 TaxID=3364020 RepID=UPI0036D03E81